MNIHDKLYIPENLYTKVLKPPEWMNPTMVKLFTYHCEFFLSHNSLLRTGINSLQIFISLEYQMVMARVNNLPLEFEMCQVYKLYCDTMFIDSNVNARLDCLRAQNWSFEDGKNI